MTVRHLFVLPILAAAAASVTVLASAASAAPVAPAAVNAILPPPGQYRVDIDGSTAYADGATMSTHQAGGGPVTIKGTQPGRAPGTRTIPNTGPRTVCLPPRTASAGFDPMALAGRNGCKGDTATAGADAVTFTGHCQGMDMTTVVRKLNAGAWEMTTRVDMRPGVQTTPDFAQQRKTLEWATTHAADADTRANARKSLDHWAEYEADMRRAAKEAGAAGAVGASMRHTATVRLTRVADTCKP